MTKTTRSTTFLLSATCLAGILAIGIQPGAAQTVGQARKGNPPDLMHMPSTASSSVTVRGDGSGKIFIALNLSRPAFWLYDSATASITPTTPQFADNTSPTQGIGVVVKKNPGSSARVALSPDTGTGTLPADLEDGQYDLIIHIPPAPPSPLVPTARQATRPGGGTRIVFSLVKSAGGFVLGATAPQVQNMAINTKGTGSI